MDYVEVIKNIVENLPCGLCSEAHVVAEIYHKLRCDGNLSFHQIRLEWPYPTDRKWKCDIFLDTGTGVWIEVKAYVKNETPNTRSGKHTKYKSSPVTACNKLKENRCAKKILAIYQDVDYESRIEGHRWSDIERQCRQHDIVFIRREPTGRIPGLHSGSMEATDDFDAPLPDDFWLGQP
jgi:hypothetical protein